MNKIVLTYFTMHCIKTILFGSTSTFHSVIFDYSQYSAVNANLPDINSSSTEEISGLISWMVFGLNAHSDNATVKFLYNKYYGDDSNNTKNITNRNLYSKYYDVTSANQTDKMDLQQMIDWFHANRFMITVISIITFISIMSMGYLIFKFFPKKKQRDTILPNGVGTSDGALLVIKNKYFSPTFISFVITIVLTSYCNLATVIFWQLWNFNETNTIIMLFVISTLILIIIGFPLFIMNIFFDKKIDMYDKKCMDNYGCLYLGFKEGISSKFILLILLRQFLYAIFINISITFTYTQNTLILVLNIIFLGLIFFIDPYESVVTKYQNIILTSTLILVSLLNYYILSLNNNKASLFWYTFSMVAQLISMFVYCGIILYKYIKPLFKKEYIIRNILKDKLKISATGKYNDSSDDEEFLVTEDTVVNYIHDNEYKKESSQRLIHELENSHVNIN